ncbi:MAG: threonylcarbamoyl-AMP synthase [Planctomycetes bacterium]|nr:threonylcarbamoyl-AMP synthase [Planctomycetota bacterium]
MTLYVQVPPRDFDPELLREPAEILRAGGVVAFPTETVYGIGASSKVPDAVQRLAQLKRRPEGKPFSFHLASVEGIAEVAEEIPPVARTLLKRYCPGPITLVVPTGKGGERRMVGVRVPANEIARTLIELAGAPLLVPSANPSGEPPAVCAEDVSRYFGDQLDAIVDGGAVLLKQASTVVQVDEKGYEVLREGFITREMIHQLLEGRRILFVCTGNTCRSPMAVELYRRQLAARLGKSVDDLSEMGYRVASAGTFAVWGARASENAQRVLAERGYDLSGHVSQPLTPDLLAGADRVLALGHSHHQIVERMLEELPPEKRPRLEMLTEEGILDPVGGEIETYRACAAEIEKAVLRLLPR